MIIEIQLKTDRNSEKLWLEVWEVDRLCWLENKKKIISFVTNVIKIYENYGITEFDKEEIEEGETFIFRLLGKPFVFYELQENIDEYLNAMKKNKSIVF